MSNSKMMVSVNEGQFEFDNLNLDELDIIESQNGKFHILHNNKSFRAEILDVDYSSNTFRIQINDSKFDLKLLDEHAQLIEKLGFSLNQHLAEKEITAPMPGLILSVSVQKGDTVQKGEALAILEAMKMENIIKSPCDGLVKSIGVKKGEAVEKGQLLVELE